uniref:(northern house mosquito) hypothetical protein n=1 Tax=Culex pipiens TaxID=7175 RepID=A0A8D8GF11_CULPI
MLRNRFPPRIPRMNRRLIMSRLDVIIRGGRTVSPGHHLLHHFHLVLLHDLNPLLVVGIRPALMLLVFLYLLHLLMFLVLLLRRGRLLLPITPGVPVRPRTDVLLLVLAAAAPTFLTLPAAPLHLHVLRARTVRRFRGIGRARAGAALVLFLRLAHPAATESIESFTQISARF